MSGWYSPELGALYFAATKVAESLKDGSTEQAFILEALQKIELADEHLAKSVGRAA